LNILLIGSGGREHALAQSLVSSKTCSKLFAAPGNPGIWAIAEKAIIDISNYKEMHDFCQKNDIKFIVVGPEQPLADGITDVMSGMGYVVFGPSKFCSQLESSKDFAKNVMLKAKIPTAAFQSFNRNQISEAHQYVESSLLPIVIKADGLAAGKGVIIAQTYDEAHHSIDEIFGGIFGDAGNKIVIEEFMSGEEASIFVVTDGIDYLILPPAQDHKRISDNDEGKNTGGMGAFAPAGIVNNEVMLKVENLIIRPLLNYFNSVDFPYRGLLYIGLMIKDNNPKVVEFNVRFGDPETQAVLPLIEGDVAKLFYTAATGKIDKNVVSIVHKKTVCIVLASKGYPDSFVKGYEIKIPENFANNDFLYHAGTKLSEDSVLITNGGRVLSAVSMSDTLQGAINSAYNLADLVEFQNKYCRKDIGKKGLKYE